MSISDDIAKFEAIVKADLETAWTDIETVGGDVIAAIWQGIKPALTTIEPMLLADAVQLAQAAVQELGSGAAIGDVLTTVSNMAYSQGKQAVTTIESNLLTAIGHIQLSAAFQDAVATASAAFQAAPATVTATTDQNGTGS